MPPTSKTVTILTQHQTRNFSQIRTLSIAIPPQLTRLTNITNITNRREFHQSPKLNFSNISQKSRKLVLDATHEEIFPTRRANIKYETELSLKDKIRSARIAKRQEFRQINNHKYAQQMFDIFHYALYSQELKPATLSWNQLDFIPSWIDMNNKHDSGKLNSPIEIDLLKVGFDLQGVILPNHRQYAIVYWSYNDLCQLPGGLELCEKVISLYRQTLRSVIAMKLDMKRTPRLFFKHVNEPDSMKLALNYQNKMELTIRNAASKKLPSYDECLGMEGNIEHFDKLMEDIYGDWSIGDSCKMSKVENDKNRLRNDNNSDIMLHSTLEKMGLNVNNSKNSNNNVYSINSNNNDNSGSYEGTSYSNYSSYKKLLHFFDTKVKTKKNRQKAHMTAIEREFEREKRRRKMKNILHKKREKSEVLSMILSVDHIHAQNYSYDIDRDDASASEEEDGASDDVSVMSKEEKRKRKYDTGIRLKDGNILFMARKERNENNKLKYEYESNESKIESNDNSSLLHPTRLKRSPFNMDSNVYVKNDSNGEMRNVTNKIVVGYDKDMDLVGIVNDE